MADVKSKVSINLRRLAFVEFDQLISVISRTSTSFWVYFHALPCHRTILTTNFAGNTSDQDSDREPEPPTKTIDKPTARLGKRDAPASAPADSTSVGARGGRGGRRGGGFSGSEAGNWKYDVKM